MHIHEAVADYILAHRVWSPNTVANTKQRLTMFSDWCEQEGVTLEMLRASHIRLFLDSIAGRQGQHGEALKSSSVRAYGKSVKALVNWLVSESEEDYTLSPKLASRIEIPKAEQTVIEIFTPLQIEALFLAVEKQPYPVRDKAILSVLLDTGIRVSELCSLTLDHIWLDADDSYLKVKGKGRKEREVPIGRQTRLAIRRYITRYRKPATSKETHVFLSHVGKPLTRNGINQLLANIAYNARIKGVRCSPHTFRHTFACMYLLNGGDLYKLSRLLGHQKSAMSEIYLRAITGKQIRQATPSILDHLKDL